MKQLKFNEELSCLVDKAGTKYQGRRFSTVSAHSDNKLTYKDAERDALSHLLDLAEKRNADAYEVISSSFSDSHQEYDPTPYTATITAILYTSKPGRFIKNQSKDK